MPEFDIQQAMERIEGKLDRAIQDHGERLATVETKITDIKEDMHDAEVKSWIKLAGVYVITLGSHLGLGKLGIKL